MSSPQLIVHATLEYGENGWGGTATAVALAATGTAALGVETIVISPGGEDADTVAAGGYRTRIVATSMVHPGEIYGAASRASAGARISELLFEAISAEHGGRPLWLIVHSEELAVLLALGAGASWCQQPLAFSHGLAAQEHPGRQDLAEQQGAFFAAARLVFVASENQRKLAERLYPATRFRCLALPLGLLVDELAPIREGSMPRASGRLLAAGRAVPQKGFDILLRAVAMVGTENGLHLDLFLGHGEQAVMKQCATLAAPLGDRARILSWSSRANLLHEIAHAAAVIVPSRFEPLGLIAAEALALGTPVIATRVGGLAELLEPVEGTILVDSDKAAGARPEQLAGALAAVPGVPAELAGPQRLKSYSLARFGEALNL